ncbi:hypothetical protein N7492_006373 [Penicillium capsulatum]|uniref:Uncharacterized protein n=1 Tax=Penicillium capsulatum TaxID=69766 RepID=A0A9W9LM21_9EURO|nr:hypothetical protein N7492_006373 [Penicillium capsulatum]KAJ6109021.1 hypothetical protein N7512_008858 [Penicillium capsulatum]
MSNAKERSNAMNSFQSSNYRKLYGESISDALKRHSQSLLDQGIGREQPPCEERGDLSKAVAEMKGAQKKHGAENMSKKEAYEELIRMGGETPEG